MKRYIVLALAAMLLTGCAQANDATGKYRIGVVQLAEHPSLDATYEGLVEVLDETLGNNSYTIELQNAQGDMAVADTISRKYVSDKVDLIYAIATNAAQAAVNAAKGTDIPVVFNAVTDPVSAGLVNSMEDPQANVTGVSDISPAEKQLAIVKEILPNAQKVGILYNVGEVNSEYQIELLESLAPGLGLEILKKGVASQSDLQIAAQQLVSDVDAVFNITDNMVVSATAMIVDISSSENVPVFATEDGQFDQGILATESISYHQLGRSAGDIVKRILADGEVAANIPVVVSEETNLYINDTVAQRLGITLPESVLARRTERK